MRVKVLFIETEDIFRRHISEHLRREKYTVFEASGEADTKRIVQEKDVDVVLLGMRGLKKRGLSVLKMIKDIRPRAEVILITPSEDISLSIEGMKLGASDDLWVPFDIETLIQRVREAHERKTNNGDALERLGLLLTNPPTKGLREGDGSMKIKVLLVDDEREFVDVLAERLEMRDFEVIKASSGDEAVAHVRDEDIDVVVLDVMMPGKDGLTTLNEIKQAKPIVEVIMLTGHGTVESAVEGMKAGAHDYLMKPAETKDLLEKIVKAYQRKVEHEERIRRAEIEKILMRRGWP